jgi:hypothetical protein
MMGNPSAKTRERPDNHNDQARAHFLARESAEERSEKTRGGVLSKNPVIYNCLKSNHFKKCLTGGL